MKSYNPINLNRLELQNFRIQNLAAFPGSPLTGMVFFHTVDLTYYGYNGSSWVNLGQQLTANDIVNFINGSILKIDDKNLSDNVNNAISQMHSHNNKSILDSTTASYTTAEKTKLSGIENNADVTDSDNIGTSINSTIAKTTMVDTDTIPILNSASSNSLSKITWSNIKSALKTYFDTLYNKYVHPNHTGDVISSGDGTTAISNNVVTNAKLADVSANTIKGRASSGTGDPEDLTASQVKTILSLSNVENKSSATIRNEITKANITLGLGYTPVKSDGVILEVKSGTLANRPAATGSGLLYFDSDGKIWRDISNGVWLQTGGQELPIATGTILGGIKVGANLSISEDGILSANDNPANFIIKQELFTASSGQTQFVLTKGQYKPNTNTLFWYLNGQKQENNVLIETSSTTFTINGGVDEGSDIIIEYIELINASPFPYHSSEHLSDGVDPIPLAKSTKEGLMSKEDFNKLANISNNAEVNQNAFSNLKVGSTTVAADSKTDTLELVAGTGITLTPDAANDKITITSVNQYIHPNHTGDVTSAGDGATVICNDAVGNAKLTNMAANTIKGNNTASTSDPKDLTVGEIKTMLALNNVTNSSQIPLSLKGAVNGVAELDETGKIPSSQLPSYVDDVLEYANLAGFPAVGETGKIYTAIDTSKIYRWSGSSYVVISDSIALGETSSTAYRGDRGKIAYDHSQTSHNYEPVNSNIQSHISNTSNPHSTTKSHVGLGNVENYGVATQAQAEAGTLNSTYMTPLRMFQALNNYIRTNSITKKFVADIGNGSDTEFIITHSFGTKDLTYGIEEVSTSEMVWVDMLKVDNNKVKLIFGVVPSISQFRLTLIG